MGGFLSIMMFAVVLLIAVGWGFITKWKYVATRLITILFCGLVALIVAFSVKDLLLTTAMDQISLYIPHEAEEAWNYLREATVLQDALISFGSALAAPIVFVVVFMTLAVITWLINGIIFIIIALVNHGKNDDRHKSRHPGLIIVLTFVHVFITFGIFVVPTLAYMDAAPAVVDAIRESDVLKDSPETEAALDSIDEYRKNPLITVYSTLGGKAFSKALTSFEVAGEKIDLSQELGAIARFAMNVQKLTGKQLPEYSAEEAETIGNLAAGFEDSKLLTVIVGEVVYGATDVWLNDSGNQKFFGIAKPDLTKEANTVMFADAFDHILEAFHGDARQPAALRADVHTLSELMKILAKDGMFAMFQNPDTNELVKKLSSGTTVQELVEVLGQNRSFKILISDMTNIGMRAIGSSLKIPENAEAIYSQFTEDIADAINSLKAEGGVTAEQKAELAVAIRDAFAESGNELDLATSILELYAETILTDFEDYETVTADDVAEFFGVFAEVSNGMEEDGKKTTPTSFGLAFVSGQQKKEKTSYSGSTYQGKTTEELKKGSGAGMLATILHKLSATSSDDADEEAFNVAAHEILKEAYTDYAVANGKDTSAAETFATSYEIKPNAVSKQSILGTASMESAQALSKVTVRITMQDLLVNSGEAAKLLNSPDLITKEAESIQNILGSVGEFLEQLQDDFNGEINGSLSNFAQALGSTLDHLSGTTSVGSAVTDRLLVAVFQSKTIRESAGLDMTSATEMALAAVKKDEQGNRSSFTETMGSISAGSEIADKLSQNESLTEKDVHDLLENMTPQTANMMKIYMTESRVQGFGVPEDKTGITAELLQNLFTEMSDKAKYGDRYDTETKGILKLFDLVAATKNNTEYTHLFNRSNDKGSLNATADEVIIAMVESNMVSLTLMKTLYKDGAYILNPFGLDIEPDSVDYNEVVKAIERYYEGHTEKGQEVKDRLNAIAALLGVSNLTFAD